MNWQSVTKKPEEGQNVIVYLENETLASGVVSYPSHPNQIGHTWEVRNTNTCCCPDCFRAFPIGHNLCDIVCWSPFEDVSIPKKIERLH